jgi:transcriptional regulator GlxA family with amidase domain
MRTRDLRLAFVCFAIRPVRGEDRGGGESDVLRRYRAGHAVSARSAGRLEPWLEILCHGDQGAFGTRRCELAARMLVLEAMDLLADRRLSTTTVPASPDIVDRALAFIETNIRRPFAVGELAEHCCCSARHLRRVFRARTGSGLMDAISERRMRLAAQDLLMRFSAGQVARSLGFSSAAHFTRLFRRYHGITPKRFQLEHAPAGSVPRTEFR